MKVTPLKLFSLKRLALFFRQSVLLGEYSCAFLVSRKSLLVVSLWDGYCYKYHCQGDRFSQAFRPSDVYNSIYPKGSQSAGIYGLPKLHKERGHNSITRV